MSLKNKAISGVKWTTLSSIFSVTFGFFQTVILVRLLDAEDFGLMALVYVVINIATPLVEMGIGNAIIQNKEVTHRQLSTLYWLNIGLGILAFLAIIAISPWMAGFYKEPLLQYLVILVGASFLIAPLGNQYGVLFRKDLNFKMNVKINIVGVVFGFLVAVTVAWQGWGVYALVANYLSKVICIAFLQVLFGRKLHKPAFIFNFGDVKHLIRFGAYQLGDQIANRLSLNVGRMILGKFLGVELLGHFSIAWNAIIMPVSKINPILNRVAFPVFSKIQEDPDKINSYYSKAISVLMLINFPLLFGLALVSHEFVDLLYGSRWERAADVISILAFYSLIRTFGNPGGPVILAKGRADVSFYWNIIKSCIFVFIIFVFLYIDSSLKSAALSMVFGQGLLAVVWHFLVARIGKIHYRPILFHLAKMIIITAVMSAGVYAMNFLIQESMITLLISKIIVGVLIYCFLIYTFDKRSFSLLKNNFLNKKKVKAN